MDEAVSSGCWHDFRGQAPSLQVAGERSGLLKGLNLMALLRRLEAFDTERT